MDFFLLLAYASLASSRTLLQQLLAYLNFILDSDLFLVSTNEKANFYELWKQPKTMKMSEAWPNTYDEECIHQLQPTKKIISSSRCTKFKDTPTPLMVHLSNDHEDYLSQQKNSRITNNQIFSNKKPQLLLNFETFKFAVYWREALISKPTEWTILNFIAL